MSVEVVKHGGKRPKAGRPPKLAKQIAAAKELASELKDVTRLKLHKLIEAYPDLLTIAIEKAKGGNERVLLYLLELPTKYVKLEEEEGETKGKELMKGILTQIKIDIEGDLVLTKEKDGTS